jgi:SAM-dependent methyltransferase
LIPEMAISDEAFAKAQTEELANWSIQATDQGRIMHELIEHSEPIEPLRRLCVGMAFDRALDVGIGCFGLGFIAVHLAGQVRSIDGLDPLPRIDVKPLDPALAAYVQAIRSRLDYVQGKAEDIPAPPSSYDLVACINVVDHAQNPELILREIDRVLVPGGMFVFGVNTLSTIGEWKWKLMRRAHPSHWHFLAHPHTYQWRRADALVRGIRGEVLWTHRPSAWQRLAGHGAMSFWIVRKSYVASHKIRSVHDAVEILSSPT